jgi:hypothetical protein
LRGVVALHRGRRVRDQAAVAAGDRDESDGRDDLFVVALLPGRVEDRVAVEQVLQVEGRQLELHGGGVLGTPGRVRGANDPGAAIPPGILAEPGALTRFQVMVAMREPMPELEAEASIRHIREALWEIDLALLEVQDEGLRRGLTQARARLMGLAWAGLVPVRAQALA